MLVKVVSSVIFVPCIPTFTLRSPEFFQMKISPYGTKLAVSVKSRIFALPLEVLSTDVPAEIILLEPDPVNTGVGKRMKRLALS